jgi:hypothetical protein
MRILQFYLNLVFLCLHHIFKIQLLSSLSRHQIKIFIVYIVFVVCDMDPAGIDLFEVFQYYFTRRFSK